MTLSCKMLNLILLAALYLVSDYAEAANPHCIKDFTDQIVNHSKKTMQGKEIDYGLIQKILDQVSGAKLVELQNQSLLEQLKRRGVKIFSTDARVQLENLSSNNLERFQERYSIVPNSQSARIQAIVDRIDVFFAHNTKKLEGKPEQPLLSSRTLAEMGLPVGNNTAVFNSEFLKNDDQVFFFAKPLFDEIDPDDLYSLYGDRALTLSTDYAEKTGWISVFLMHPSQLSGTLAVTAISTEEHNLANELFSIAVIDKKFEERRMRPGNLALAEQAVQLLKRTDFTVRDYRTLLRMAWSYYLYHLEPSIQEKVLGDIETGNLGGRTVMNYLNYATNGTVTDPLLKAWFELKVPVAVPPNELEFHLKK